MSNIILLLLLPLAYVVRREGNSFTLLVCPQGGGVPISHNALQHFPECHGAAGGGTLPGPAGGVPWLGGVPWPGGYPGWGGTLARGGTLAGGGVPWWGGTLAGGYPGQGGTLASGGYPGWGGTLTGVIPWRGGTLARGGTQLGQHRE